MSNPSMSPRCFNGTELRIPSALSPDAQEICDALNSGCELTGAPKNLPQSLSRHLIADSDLVVVKRDKEGEILGICIASDIGIRGLVNSVTVSPSVEESDRAHIASEILSTAVERLKERGLERILCRGPRSGESDALLSGARFVEQPGESFLHIDLNEDTLRGVGQEPSSILAENPWGPSFETTEGLLRSERFISEIVDKVGKIEGLHLAPFETEERLRHFTAHHGVILGHELCEPLSFGFFAHSGIEGTVWHLARLKGAEASLKGLGVDLVELGMGYLHARGIERVTLCTTNESATSFWQQRGWRVEENVNLWQWDAKPHSA